MKESVDSTIAKRPRVWPGMPTRNTKLVELLFVFFPIWVALIGIIAALLMPLIQSCRSAAINNAEQVLPLNVDAP